MPLNIMGHCRNQREIQKSINKNNLPKLMQHMGHRKGRGSVFQNKWKILNMQPMTHLKNLGANQTPGKPKERSIKYPRRNEQDRV